MGEIIVPHTIAQEMNRIDWLIEHKGVYYDPSPVEGYISFCNNELVLTDGSPFHMLDTFKVWSEEIFGWYYFIEREVFHPDGRGGGYYVKKTVKKRLTTKQFLIVARGAAKSMYSSSIQAYFLAIDPETTHQIVTAPTMKQAEEIITPIKTALTISRGPYLEFMTEGSIQNTTGNRANRPKICATKKGIENFVNGSLLEVRPMSIDKLNGLRTKVNSIDEWLSGHTSEDVVGAVEQGSSKLEDYLIIATSSEGTVRNGPGDNIKMELAKILNGEYFNPFVSIWYYRLDSPEEVGMPHMWMKANPNLGYTVQYDVYHQDVERAQQSPSNRNDILAKRFGIPLEGYTQFFPYEETIPSIKPLNFWGMDCSLGGDLSQGDDFCAFTFLFPLEKDQFGVKTLSYITEYTFNKLNNTLREKYNEFINEGSLIIMNGTNLDMMEVYDDLENRIADNEYNVTSFGYDPYNAREFVTRWETKHGPFGLCKVPQGARTESVPLGEIKKISTQRGFLFDQKIMQFSMEHCITQEDSNGNRKLYKRRREEKIDNVAALLDSYVAYKTHKDVYW